MDNTHYIPPFTRERQRGQFQQAFCGDFVDRRLHSAEPTCGDCAKALAQEAADFETIQNERWDPALVVKHVPFDPCAGYKERVR